MLIVLQFVGKEAIIFVRKTRILDLYTMFDLKFKYYKRLLKNPDGSVIPSKRTITQSKLFDMTIMQKVQEFVFPNIL
jgi:hypothetical protein